MLFFHAESKYRQWNLEFRFLRVEKFWFVRRFKGKRVFMGFILLGPFFSFLFFKGMAVHIIIRIINYASLINDIM